MRLALVTALLVLATATPPAAAAVTVSVQGATVDRSVSSAPRERPGSLAYGPDTSIDELTWSSWGGSSASGTGTFNAYGGLTETHDQVTIRLDRIRRCGPHRLYTRAVVTDASGASPTTMRLSLGCQVFVDIRTNGGIEYAELVQRPTRWWSDGDQTSRMRWRGWNRSTARGRGRLRLGYNHGASSGTTVRRRLQYRGVRYCGAVGRFIYTHVSSRYRLRGRLIRRSGATNLSYECGSAVARSAAASPRYCGAVRGHSEVHSYGASCAHARAAISATFTLPPDGNVPGSPDGWSCARITGAPPTGLSCRGEADGATADTISAPSGNRRKRRNCYRGATAGNLYVVHGIAGARTRGITCATAHNTLAYWASRWGDGTSSDRGPTGYRCRKRREGAEIVMIVFRCRRGARRLSFNLGGG